MKFVAAFMLALPALVANAQQNYTVTTLADSGGGSLRDAVSKGGRTITFRIGGTIKLRKMLEITADDIVIDGASAPAPGITVREKTFSITDAGNITIRHLRFRYADNDSFRIVGACRNILIENCSATHGGDGALDITHDWKKTGKRPNGIIVRNCLIAATDKAMLVVGVDNLRLERNLFTNTGQRNPQLHDARNFNLINNHIRNFTVYGVRARAGATGNAIGNLIPLSPLLPKRPDRTFLIDQKSAPPLPSLCLRQSRPAKTRSQSPRHQSAPDRQNARQSLARQSVGKIPRRQCWRPPLGFHRPGSGRRQSANQIPRIEYQGQVNALEAGLARVAYSHPFGPETLTSPHPPISPCRLAARPPIFAI
jgi:hypothetical protein